MSNKTELQNNNTEFQSNNIDLQSILDIVNALPEEKTLTDLMPTLSDPATAADVANGKQFVDSTGAVVNGTLEKTEAKYNSNTFAGIMGLTYIYKGY